MGIDFFFFLQIQKDDDTWETIEDKDVLNWNELVKTFFPTRGFYLGDLAKLIGFPKNDTTILRKEGLIEMEPFNEYRCVFLKDIKELNEQFNTKWKETARTHQLEYSDYSNFRLFLIGLMLDQEEYKYKKMNLVVATDFY
jgi:hypothetical protein